MRVTISVYIYLVDLLVSTRNITNSSRTSSIDSSLICVVNNFAEDKIGWRSQWKDWWNFVYLYLFHWLWVVWFDWLRHFKKSSFLGMFFWDSRFYGSPSILNYIRTHFRYDRVRLCFVIDNVWNYIIKFSIIYALISGTVRSAFCRNLIYLISAVRCMGLFTYISL